MTLQELHDWTEKLMADFDTQKVRGWHVILNPGTFGDRPLGFQDLALRPPKREKHGPDS